MAVRSNTFHLENNELHQLKWKQAIDLSHLENNGLRDTEGLCDLDSEGRLVFFEPQLNTDDITSTLNEADDYLVTSQKTGTKAAQTNKIRGLTMHSDPQRSGVRLHPLSENSEKLLRGLDSAVNFASHKATKATAEAWLRSPELINDRSVKVEDSETELQLGVLKTLQDEWKKESRFEADGEKKFDLDLGEYLSTSEFALRRVLDSVKLLQDPYRKSQPFVQGQFIEMQVEAVSNDLEQWLLKLSTIISVYHVQLLDFIEKRKAAEAKAQSLEEQLKKSEENNAHLRREVEYVRKELVLFRSKRRCGAMLGLKESDILQGMEATGELRDLDNMTASMDLQNQELLRLRMELEKARAELQKVQELRAADRHDFQQKYPAARGGITVRGLSDENLKLCSDIAFLAGAKVADQNATISAALQELSSEMLTTGAGLRAIFEDLGGFELLRQLRPEASGPLYDEMGNVIPSYINPTGLRDAHGNLLSKATARSALYERIGKCLFAVDYEVRYVEKDLRQLPDADPMARTLGWCSQALKAAMKSCQLAAEPGSDVQSVAQDLRWPEPPDHKPGALKEAFLNIQADYGSSGAGASRGQKSRKKGRGGGKDGDEEGEIDPVTGRRLISGSNSGSWDGSSNPDEEGGRKGKTGNKGGKAGAGARPASQGGQRRRPGDPFSSEMGGAFGKEMSAEGAAACQMLEDYLDRVMGVESLIGLIRDVEDIQLRDQLTAALHDWRRRFPKSPMELVCWRCRRVCKEPEEIASFIPPKPLLGIDMTAVDRHLGRSQGGAVGGLSRPPIVSLAEGKDLLLSQLPWLKADHKPGSKLSTSKSDASLLSGPKGKRILM